MAVSPVALTHGATDTLGASLSAAFVYSVLWYARAYAKNGEPFRPRKFIATLIVGLFIGTIAWSADVVLTEKGFLARMAVYAGLISLVEAVLKTVYNEWYRITGGSVGLSNTDWGRRGGRR